MFSDRIALLLGRPIFMSTGGVLGDELERARALEEAYEWAESADVYSSILRRHPSEDAHGLASIHERMGYTLFQHAMQSDTKEQFEERCAAAVSHYEQASQQYFEDKARVFRCEASIAYVNYWLAPKFPRKMDLLKQAWTLAKQSLKSFQQAKEPLEYGRTYNQLSPTCYFLSYVEPVFQTREKLIMEAVEIEEQAISFLTDLNAKRELAKTLATAAVTVAEMAYCFVPIENREPYIEKALGHWKNAVSLSEEDALLKLLYCHEDLDWIPDLLVGVYDKALELARKTRDKFLTASALDMFAYYTFWRSLGFEDPGKTQQCLTQALHYAEEARELYAPLNFVSWRTGTLWTGGPYAEYCWELARMETDPVERRGLLQKAIEEAKEGLELAQETGYLNLIGNCHHLLSKILGSMAQYEHDLTRKKGFLKGALEHREDAVRIWGQFDPYGSWSQGVMLNYLADLKAELSSIEKDPQLRRDTLMEAVSGKERCLALCINENQFAEKIGELDRFPVVGRYQYQLGELLVRLHSLTKDEQHQRKAIIAFEEATISFRKVGMTSRIAECLWKAAKGYDELGEHEKASERFSQASESYVRTAEQVRQLKGFYRDHASYMQAWSLIELAKHHHIRQEYDLAKTYYQKTAQTHESIKRWSYLAPNYQAWAQIEGAEELSRKDQNPEAIRAFTETIQAFEATRRSLKSALTAIENLDERQNALDLIQAAGLRGDYCRGRIAIEEAKILDKKGDHIASSEEYAIAARTFEKIGQSLDSVRERNELLLITVLSHAWQKMTQAEAESATRHYSEASQFFEQAKDLSQNEKTRALSLGYSRFCKALEAGTRFIDTGDPKLHGTAVQYLETASSYYLKAGNDKASEYAKATGFLFDAYLHLNNAKKEKDPDKKAKLLAVVEKVLQTSADVYAKAEHPEKREQVLAVLREVQEEKELTLSLYEILRAPILISTSVAFPTPTPTYEKPVGLDRFEHGDIQINLTTTEEATVGEELTLRLDLVNVAKNFALMVRINNLFPPSFKVASPPADYAVESGSIDMKGRRLEPLKVETIKMGLEASKAGDFEFSPQLLYVDDVGQFRTSRIEPVTLNVVSRINLEFKSGKAEVIFNFLADSFTADYMRRRLALDNSGWRTLMEVIRKTKIPKSCAYGRGGKRGSAILELENRGLVETRTFPGERGRGGEILKVRVYYDKETVKRLIDRQVTKIKEK